MIVHPGIVNHPKFLGLKAMVGDLAMEYLVRIWGHCQLNKKGQIWSGATPMYVEMVAAGESKGGRLYKSLLTQKWIDETDGAVVIHDWAKHNPIFPSRWNRSQGRGLHPTPPTMLPLTNPPTQEGTQPGVQTAGDPRTYFYSNLVSGTDSSGGIVPSLQKERERTEAAADVLASRTRAGAILAQIRGLERGEQTSASRAELRKKRRELAELQAAQAEGKFQ